MSQHITQIQQFNNNHRIDENQKISAGYKDGGRRMKFDGNGQPLNKSSREIITVKDPSEDVHLAIAIGKAKNATRDSYSVADKANDLSAFIDRIMPNDPDNNGYVENNVNQEVSLGDLIENGVGVCRHRSLLFKVLADAIGLPSALVRGHYEGRRERGAHAWNEITGENGQKIIVDAMHQKSIGMSNSDVECYRHLDGEPMYDQKKNSPFISNEQDLLGQTDAEQSVGCAQWAMTSKGDLYLDPRGISQQEVNSMKRMLNVLGIKNDDHETGAFGGGKQEVIRVTGDDVEKIKRLQSGISLHENINQTTPQVHKDTAPVSAKSAFSAVTNGLSEKLQVGVGNAIKATAQAMKNVFGGG